MRTILAFTAALALAGAPSSAETTGEDLPTTVHEALHALHGAVPTAGGKPVPAGKCGKGGCGPVKPVKPLKSLKQSFRPKIEVVVHNGYAYLEMDKVLQAAIQKRTTKSPVIEVNGLKVKPFSGPQLKTMDDVLCTVSAAGVNSETLVGPVDAKALAALGAKRNGNGRFPGRVFLRIEVKAAFDRLAISVPIASGAPVTVRTTILYF